jgi:hypothetical protein
MIPMHETVFANFSSTLHLDKVEEVGGGQLSRLHQGERVVEQVQPVHFAEDLTGDVCRK